MSKTLKALALSLVLLSVVACDNTPAVFKGFKKMDSGAYMKFYERSASKVSPRLKDGVTFEMSQYFNDTLLYTTVGDSPVNIVLEPASFVGDVSDALLAMHVGDSARLVVLSDSVFIAVMGMEAIEEYAGKPIYYDLKLLSVRPFEEIEAENQRIADSLKVVEQAYLEALKSDAKNEVTESGLIILEQNGKGKVAQMGDYVDFDFTLLGQNGDTLMNSFGIESVDMLVSSEEFICKGFDEAMCMVPEKGNMTFVIPSDLGFGSTGYEGVVKPYSAMTLVIRMNEVMDKEAHDKKMAALEADKEVERQSLLAIEQDWINTYLKDNAVTEKPTESGLYIIREVEGKGELAQWGDVVYVHYVLSNLDGKVVESSYDYEQPISFKLGNNEMIPAIEEAVMTMAPGARVTLISPSELAFGEFVIDEELLPAYSPLLIELELVSVEN